MGSLISKLRVTPETAQPGESVLVEVLGADGQPIADNSGVMINGVRGAAHYLQYPGPGQFRVSALATVDNVVDTASSTVEVSASTWPDVPIIDSGFQIPRTIRRLPFLTATRSIERHADYRLQIAANDTLEFAANLKRRFQQDPEATKKLDAALTITMYHWDFGNGVATTTANGFVDHDFSTSLAVDEEHRLFDISCGVETAGAGVFDVKRTLSVVNAYAVCRRNGVIAPPVMYESYARKVLTAFEARVTVKNLEAVALSLDKRRVTYECGTTESVGAVETLAAPILLPPNSITLLTVLVPFEEVPADANGIGVVFAGKDAAGRAVHVETHLDVALPDNRTTGLLSRSIALTKIAALGIDKIVNPPEEEHTVGHGPAHVVPTTMKEKGTFWIGQHSVPVETWTREKTYRVWRSTRSTFDPGAAAVETLADFSERVQQLVVKDDFRETIFGGAPASPSLRSQLKAADIANLQTIADFAKNARGPVGPPSAGADCDPDNLPDTPDDAWTCQIKQSEGKDEMIDWHYHAGFVNARKGDLLLAPGGPSGLIGGLLRQVTPPQYYGHMGIMTRNHDMITHSTFSEKRLFDRPNGKISLPFGLVDEPAPTDGFEPNALRYGWPGVVTQWVSSAVGGSKGNFADLDNMPAPGQPETEMPAVDPDGKPYDDISPFNKYADTSFDGAVWQIIPPLVVKPDPLEETPAVRQQLHAIADAALACTGKSHYRFYCYTDGSISLNLTAPPDAGWAAGTFPSVCSSFIWALLRRQGIPMESTKAAATTADLEAKDVSAGAEVGDSSEDGLYLYRADERQVAAQWLHESLKQVVAKTLKERVTKAAQKAGIDDLTDQLSGLAGGLINTLSDIGDDVANQMVNAFASDDASTAAKDSDAWKSLQDSRAVSPDNTLFWDPPSAGGIYGYAVPAAFMPARVERAPHYVWTYAPTHGQLKGVVRVDGEPKSRALVQLNDGGDLTVYTDAAGRYTVPKVPFGRYLLKAQWDQGDGIVLTVTQPLDMAATSQRSDIDLQRPAELYRRISVTGEMYFMKYYTVGTNPRQAFEFSFTVDLAPEPGAETQTAQMQQGYHGIQGAAGFLFKLQTDGTVTWSAAWGVCQDGNIVEKLGVMLSGAVEDLSLGFISGLFGNEVTGADLRKGEAGPNGDAVTGEMQIGPPDRSTGRIRFSIQNVSQ